MGLLERARDQGAADAAVAALGQAEHQLDLGGPAAHGERGEARRLVLRVGDDVPGATAGGGRLLGQHELGRVVEGRLALPGQPQRPAGLERPDTQLSAVRTAPNCGGQLALHVGEPLGGPAHGFEAGAQPRAGVGVLDLDPAVREPLQVRLGRLGELLGRQPRVGAFDAGEVVLVERRQVGGAHDRPVLPRLDPVGDSGVVAVAPVDRVPHGLLSLCRTARGLKPSPS